MQDIPASKRLSASTKGMTRRPCDLVMKGGITSGVVYPSVVSELQEEYTFKSIGGTSAGAIAAAATAAAEFGRDSGGFDKLKQLQTELVTPGLLQGLFQPTRQTKPVFDLLLDLQSRKRAVSKLRLVFWTLIKGFAVQVASWVLTTFVVISWMVHAFGGGRGNHSVASWVLLALFLFAAILIGLIVATLGRVLTIVLKHLPNSYFGMCTGMPQGKSSNPALIPWLHERLQQCAGLTTTTPSNATIAEPDLGEDSREPTPGARPAAQVTIPPASTSTGTMPVRNSNGPLTFFDLEEKGIKLRMMTTDVTLARPVVLPEGIAAYYFAPLDLERLFPKEIIRHLVETATEVADLPMHPRLYRLSPQKLPVLVATRMSLSFPVLLSAVPLWTVKNNCPVRHWLSDGGIGSNFPIHLFDSWVPSRPTFGLNLVPSDRSAGLSPPRQSGAQPALAAFPSNEGRSLFSFLRQILDTMQNWRDTMQTELPGFRDRIYDIDLAPDEGGMNLSMPSPTIARLCAKGVGAGKWFKDDFKWDDHRFHRYRTFMHLLQDGLIHEGRDERSVLQAFRSTAFEGTSFKDDLKNMEKENIEAWGKPPDWYPRAAKATEGLLKVAAGFGTEPPTDFVEGHEIDPPAAMRITPAV